MSILNKDNNGYITPDQFNQLSDQAQREIFEEYYTMYELAQQKVNSRQYGSGYADKLQHIEDLIDRFTMPDANLTFVSGGKFTLPTNYYRITEVSNLTGRQIDRVSNSEIKLLNISDKTTPTLLYPVYTLNANSIQVYPTTISSARITYVRYPATPKWTYTQVGDAPLFNQSAVDYQDFELPLSDEMNLIVRILQLCGVTIREEQVVNMAKSEEIQDKQEQ